MSSGTSSLAFRSLLKSAATRAGLGRPAARMTGLTPAAVALQTATLAQDGPMFVVVPTDADVEQLTADVRFFLGSLLGLSEDDAGRRVLPFPSQEVDPYRGLAPHLEVASARARALHALTSRHRARGDRLGPGAAAAALGSGSTQVERHRHRAGPRDRAARAGRAARARRLLAGRPRRRARRVLCAWRRRGLLSRRGSAAGAARVHRRHRRVRAPVRRRDATVARRARPDSRQPAARAPPGRGHRR